MANVTRSWREEFSASDVRLALLAAKLHGWKHEVWTDGSMSLYPNRTSITDIEVEQARRAFAPTGLSIVAGPHPINGRPMLWLELSWL